MNLKKLSKKQILLGGGIILLIIIAIALIVLFNKKNEDVPLKTLTCMKTNVDENGYIIESKIILSSKKDKIEKIESSTTENTKEDYANYLYSSRIDIADELTKIKGLTVENLKVSDTVTKYNVIIDYNTFNKADVKDTELKDHIYNAKDVKLEDYIDKNLDGYECK